VYLDREETAKMMKTVLTMKDKSNVKKKEVETNVHISRRMAARRYFKT
jgi:hypothetical protein